MYRLIAMDMDGTLLNEKKEITESTKQAIFQLKQMGKHVVLATGRPFCGIQKYIDELGLHAEKDYVVVYNGALVQGTMNQTVLHHKPLDVQAYRELYDLSVALGLHIHALTKEGVLTPQNNPYTDVEASVNDIPIFEMPVKDLPEDTEIIKVMFVDAPEKLDEAIKHLPEWATSKYAIMRSYPIFLEFLNPAATKGEGVHAIAQALGIKQEEVICVGDAGNDLAMIQYAHLGVAMANASEDLKDAADYITTSNEHDGVRHVIEKFMLA